LYQDGKTPIDSADVEKAALGSMLIDREAADKLLAKLTVGDFYDDKHRLIFEALKKLRAKGEVPDLLTVTDALRSSKSLTKAGGAAYISALANSVGTTTNADVYADKVLECSRYRAIMMAAAECVAAAKEMNPDALQRMEETVELIRSIGQNGARVCVTCLADVEAEETSWLWKPYLPLGKLAILEGDPSIGKTFLALKLTAAISQGWSLPTVNAQGELEIGERGEPQNVLYLSAEDGLGDTLKPRLIRAGADDSRVFAVTGKRHPGGKIEVPITLQDIAELDRTMSEYRPALMVVDPLQAYLGKGVDMNRAEQVRPVLAQVGALAQKHFCTILLIRHLGKSSKDRSIYRGLGSIDLAAAARSVLLVGRDPDDATKRILAHNKSSLGPSGASISFAITPEGALEWVGASHLTAAQVLAPDAVDTEEKGARAEAKEFLKEALANGPRAAREMEEECEQALGIEDAQKSSTLKRAKTELNIRSYRIGAAWYWELPKPKEQGMRQEDRQEYQQEPLSVSGDILDRL